MKPVTWVFLYPCHARPSLVEEEHEGDLEGPCQRCSHQHRRLCPLPRTFAKANKGLRFNGLSVFISRRAISPHARHRVLSLRHWTAGRTDGRTTHQGFGIGVSFLIQKNLGNFVMAAVGRHVEGSQVVVGDIVHGHVVLQEELDAV